MRRARPDHAYPSSSASLGATPETFPTLLFTFTPTEMFSAIPNLRLSGLMRAFARPCSVAGGGYGAYGSAGWSGSAEYI